MSKFFDIRFFGDHSGEVPPVPIPNTEVKLSSADGTARATVWESRSLPNSFFKPLVNPVDKGLFLFVSSSYINATSNSSAYIDLNDSGPYEPEWEPQINYNEQTTLIQAVQMTEREMLHL